MAILNTIRRRGLSYLLALVIGVAVATGQSLLEPYLGDQLPFLFSMPTVLLVATAPGSGQALLVLCVGALDGGRFSVQNLLASAGQNEGAFVLLAYLAVGLVLTTFGGRLRLSTARRTIAEEHLSLAQENTGIGVFELDFQANTAYVSASLSQLLDQPVMHGAVPLDDWLERLHPGHVAESRQAILAHVERNELSYEREQQVESPDGSQRWLLSRVRLDVDPGQRLVRARGATIDISRRREGDERLRCAQKELRQQLEDLERIRALNQELISVDSPLATSLRSALGLVADFQDARHAMLALRDDRAGPSVLAIGGEHLADAAPPSDALESCGREIVGALGATSQQQYVPLADGEPRFPLTVAMTRQLGLGAFHITPLLTVAGKPLGAITVFLPGTAAPTPRQARLCEICAIAISAYAEREQARVVAMEKDHRFAVALESSSVPFDILAPVRDSQSTIIDFRFVYLNPAAAAALGKPMEELLGQRVADALPGTWDNPTLLDRLAQVVQTGRPCEFELHSRRGDRWLNLVVSSLDTSVAVWFADITDRKLREGALRAADRRKDEFLATLAHELRGPLAPIRQAAVLAHAPGTDETRRLWSLEIIERQIKRMAVLLDDLLDVSRITRGTLQLRCGPNPLAAIIDSALETTRPTLAEKKQELSLGLPENAVLVQLDGLRVSQVLANLLTNAAKYSPVGSLIRLEAHITQTDLCMKVIDQGIGLTEEQASGIFDMFSQVPQALSRAQGGLGIGLALAKEIVTLHGGSLTVESAGLGEGSSFCVVLPHVVIGPSPAEPAMGGTGDWIESGTGGGLRVLVADDNKDAAESLGELLRMSGHEVHLAHDGEEALATFCRFSPDVALLDVGMPRMSGLEVARAIRQLSAGGHATLVAITGWGQERDRREALEAGFDHHATKPIDISRLKALIASRKAAPDSARVQPTV